MTRFGYILVTLAAAELAAGAFAAVAWLKPHPRFVWNASFSAPPGLYGLTAARQVACGDLVAIMPPAELQRFMADRHYLAKRVPLLKHIAALPGQRVCRKGTRVFVDGRRVAIAFDRDRQGRPLPVWQGCRTLTANSLFVINTPPDSFDSRYFGPIPAAGVIGRAAPILTRDTPGASFVWRGLRRAFATPQTRKGPAPCK